MRWGDDDHATPWPARTFGGLVFVTMRQIGPWIVGNAQQGAAAWHLERAWGYLIPKLNKTHWTLRGAIVDGGLVVVSSQSAAAATEADFMPFFATEPEPSPKPKPKPEPEKEQGGNVSEISAREITEIVVAAKAEVEALGERFSTKAAIDAYYAEHQSIPYDDRRRAFLVTLRVAWELARRYPAAGIGLEAYDGASGIESPFAEDGPTKYSFDIVLLSPIGPSVDILGGGVDPTAQIDPSQAISTIEAWRASHRPLLNPHRTKPAPGEGAGEPGPGDPGPGPGCACDMGAILEVLTAHGEALEALEPLLDSVVAHLERLGPSAFPTYKGEIDLGRLLGRHTVTLAPVAERKG